MGADAIISQCERLREKFEGHGFRVAKHYLRLTFPNSSRTYWEDEETLREYNMPDWHEKVREVSRNKLEKLWYRLLRER